MTQHKKLNLLVTGTLYDSQSAYSAIQFCKAAIAAGHSISQVFFYQNGVSQGTQLAEPLTDEFDASQSWMKLAEQFDIPLIICVSAAQRRGVLSVQPEAQESLADLHPGFSVAGLGALHAACLDSDRTVTFN